MRPEGNEGNEIGGQIATLLLLEIQSFRTGKKLDVPSSALDVVQQ